MFVAGDEDIIARATTSRYSIAQVGVQYECKTHYHEVFDMSSGKDWRISIIRHKTSSILNLDLTRLMGRSTHESQETNCKIVTQVG
jgi:hypothetical protein